MRLSSRHGVSSSARIFFLPATHADELGVRPRNERIFRAAIFKSFSRVCFSFTPVQTRFRLNEPEPGGLEHKPPWIVAFQGGVRTTSIVVDVFFDDGNSGDGYYYMHGKNNNNNLAKVMIIIILCFAPLHVTIGLCGVRCAQTTGTRMGPRLFHQPINTTGGSSSFGGGGGGG